MFGTLLWLSFDFGYSSEFFYTSEVIPAVISKIDTCLSLLGTREDILAIQNNNHKKLKLETCN